MAYTCKHSVKPFYNPLDGAERPTEYQIRVYKLYQCETCHKWFSFLEEEASKQAMKAVGVRAKKVIDVLTANCPNLCDHDKFHTGAYMDVVVENIGDCNLGAMFSVAHYYEQNGDLMRDPEMCFIKGKDGEYYPYYYRLDGLGIEREAIIWDDNGEMKGFYEDEQKRQANFCESWMRNIKEQQERVV